jgi:hypothetical protein
MKRSLLLASVAIFGASSVFAQEAKFPKADKSMDTPEVFDKSRIGSEEPSARGGSKKPAPKVAISQNGTVLGTSIYDLQTNASIDNRFIRNSDGTMAATWTFSTTSGPNYTDRGTGYVYFDGTSWTSAPTARLESERVGWPSVITTANGAEMVITHSTASDVLTMMRRPAKGTGSWTQSQAITSLDMVWPRVAVGGSDGNSIHLVAVTAPTGLSGTVYQGLDGALLYNRSTDAGVSWDKNDVLIPELSSTYWNGFGGDNYAIAADGDHVVIAVFPDFGDVIILESDDNGDTWNKHIALDFPITKYTVDDGIDVDMDGIPDTVETSDNSGAVLIDNNGKIHCWFGRMRRLDADLTDGNSSFFPVTSGLMYWNEDMPEGANYFLTGALDLNGNGVLDVVGNSTNGIGTYYLSLSSMPTAGVDANGDIYLAYSAHMETLNDGTQNYRHVYAIKTDDGGCTWYEPTDLTNNGVGFEECVFPAAAKDVDTKFRLTFQEDVSPGLAVRGDEDPDGTNEIVYTDITTSTMSSNAFSCPVAVDGIEDLCPGDTLTLETVCGTGWNWKDNGGSTIGTGQSVQITQTGDYTVDITTACGTETVEFEISAPAPGTGAGPNFTLSSQYMEVCVGDTFTITANGALTGSTGGYDWGSGFVTSNTFEAVGPGTYLVTVTNCVGDNTTDSITIGTITSVTATITGDPFICPGGNTTLEANDVSNAVYSWDDGSTTVGSNRTLNVTATGTYNVTVSACGFTDVASINVQVEPTPTASVTAGGNLTICEGGLVSLSANTNVDSIVWSNGLQATSIPLTLPSQSGDYYFAAYNKCGDVAQSDTVTVTINTKPSAPTISLLAGVLTSSVGTGVQWYINGNAISGANSQNYVPPASAAGSFVTAKIIDPVTGCESNFSNSVLYVPDAIDEKMKEAGLSLFPNPNSGSFTLSIENPGEYELEISNIMGASVLSEKINSVGKESYNIQLDANSKGVYLVNLRSEGFEHSLRMIVE